MLTKSRREVKITCLYVEKAKVPCNTIEQEQCKLGYVLGHTAARDGRNATVNEHVAGELQSPSSRNKTLEDSTQKPGQAGVHEATTSDICVR